MAGIALSWILRGVDPFLPKASFRRTGYGRTTWNPWGLHVGVDIAGRLGTVLNALRPGVVTFRGSYGDLGLLIAWYDALLDITWFYAHCNSLGGYRVGEKVKAGSGLARLGKTGRADGYHVHVGAISGDFRFRRDRWGSMPYTDPRPLIVEAAKRAA